MARFGICFLEVDFEVKEKKQRLRDDGGVSSLWNPLVFLTTLRPIPPGPNAALAFHHPDKTKIILKTLQFTLRNKYYCRQGGCTEITVKCFC